MKQLWNENLIPYITDKQLNYLWGYVNSLLQKISDGETVDTYACTSKERLWAYTLLVEYELIRRGLDVDFGLLEGEVHFYNLHSLHYNMIINYNNVVGYIKQGRCYVDHHDAQLCEQIVKLNAKNVTPRNFEGTWDNWYTSYEEGTLPVRNIHKTLAKFIIDDIEYRIKKTEEE